MLSLLFLIGSCFHQLPFVIDRFEERERDRDNHKKEKEADVGKHFEYCLEYLPQQSNCFHF